MGFLKKELTTKAYMSSCYYKERQLPKASYFPLDCRDSSKIVLLHCSAELRRDKEKERLAGSYIGGCK